MIKSIRVSSIKVVALLITAIILFSSCKSTIEKNSPPSPVTTAATKKDINFNPATKHIGFAISGADSLFNQAAKHGFLQQGERLGYVSHLYFSQKEGNLVEMVQKAIDQKCVGVLIWAKTPDYFEAAKLAKDSGLRVIVPFFEMPNLDNIDASVAPSVIEYTGESTRIVCEEVLRRKKQKGTILIIDNKSEPTIAQEFKESISQQYPAFSVEIYQQTDPKELIKTREDIVAILALEPGSAKIFAQAKAAAEQELSPTPTKAPESTKTPTKKQKKTPAPTATPAPTPATSAQPPSYKRNPVIVALDYSLENVDLVKGGHIFALIARPYYDSTAQSMFVMDRLLRNIPAQNVVRVNSPTIKSKNINKYNSLIKEVKKWFE